jgi:NTP pyrophosphatase (non-canonical NTP hydrolase)
MTSQQIRNLIEEELTQAREQHPNWPDYYVHRAAIVAEEAGELLRAALRFEYEDGDLADLEKESIQTAAMAIRFLEEVDKCGKGDYPIGCGGDI